METQHPQSIQRIQEIEAPKPLPEEQPEPEKQSPFFIKQLGGVDGSGGTIQVEEGDNIYLEAQTGPIDDNTVVVNILKILKHLYLNNKKLVTNSITC